MTQASEMPDGSPDAGPDGSVDAAPDGAPDGAGDGPRHLFDLRGFRCPLPVLKLRVRMKRLAPGERATVLTDDPLAAIDVPHFCTEAGQVLVEARDEGDGSHRFVVERAGAL